MPLDDDQRLLTRILTDRAFLEAFLEDPAESAKTAGYPEESALRIARIPHEQLRGSGRSLVRKRLGAVESLLPLTQQSLGPPLFQQRFQTHAGQFWPQGAKRHRADAIAFAGSIADGFPDDWRGEVARFEAWLLGFRGSNRRFTCLRLRHQPQGLVLASMNHQAPPKRSTVVMAIRLGRRQGIRRLAFPLPFWSWNR